MKRFCFFDLDGTLADTDRDIRLSWREVLARLGLPTDEFDAKFTVGPPLEEVLKILYPNRYSDSMAADARREFAAVYDSCGFPNTPEYPGVLSRVRELKSAGAYVAIVTNKRHLGTLAIAEKYGWAATFDGIYSGDMHADDPAIGKLRKPELLARIIASLGARREDCVMIGDTINDFEAAKRNGIASVGVAWGYGTPAELAEADRIANTPMEI